MVEVHVHIMVGIHGGGGHIMVGGTLWWGHIMVGGTLWWGAHYGGGHIMVGGTLWWGHIMVGAHYGGGTLWWGHIMVGGTCVYYDCGGDQFPSLFLPTILLSSPPSSPSKGMMVRLSAYIRYQNFCDGRDLALGKVATASSAFGGHRADEALDGVLNKDTCFWSESTTSHWWTVDLGMEVSITKIRIINMVGVAIGERGGGII